MKDLNTYIKESLRLKRGHKRAMTLDNVNDGVYAFYKDGHLSENVENPDDVLGIAVITNKCKFIIDKNNSVKSFHKFGCYKIDLSSSLIVCTENKTKASKDFEGYENTKWLVDHYKGTSNDKDAIAATLCWEQEYDINGTKVHGYLGSLGEWKVVHNNTEKINELLEDSKGDKLPDRWFCTSTLVDNISRFWLTKNNSKVIDYYRNLRGFIRPFFKQE